MFSFFMCKCMTLLLFTIHVFSAPVIPVLPLIQARILKTSILNFFPHLKLHHIIVLREATQRETIHDAVETTHNLGSEFYTVDFTPINQTIPGTLMKLLFAFNVPAEIRIRRISNVGFFDDERIIYQWLACNQLDYVMSQQLSDVVFHGIQCPNIKMLMTRLRDWSDAMNMYYRNCQHLSGFITTIDGFSIQMMD